MVQIYIKYIDDNYYLLDIEEKEVVNFKITAKDLSDITKIFSPFTQSFNIKATDKNKRLCGFIGNEKIQRINNDGNFDALLYVSGFLFQSGKLSFDESSYQSFNQTEFKTNFASNLTGLKDLLGDMTIQDLFKDNLGTFDQNVKIDWNNTALQNYMSSISNVNLSNGVSLKYGVPFISNKRVWTYDTQSLSTVDNIAFQLSVGSDSVNKIQLDEVRPSISYMTIMEHLLLKIGVPVICPMFQKPEVKDLFVSCSSEKLVDPNASGYNLLTGWSPLTHTYIADVPSISEKWKVTQPSNGVFKIKRQSVPNPERWYYGFHIYLAFNNLVSLEVSAPSVKVKMINDLTGVTISVQDITDMNFEYFFSDPVTGPSILDANGEIYVRFEILPNTLCAWSDIDVEVFQKYRAPHLPGSGYYYNSYYARTKNTTNSALLGGNKMNLITALPKMKCVDFLKSFFKTFNISVISTGLNDQSMYWVTPENINEYNKPYSKRIVDYTRFTNIESLTKKKGNEYNQYIFKHKDSKYYEAVYGNGTNFGELKYPLITPAKPTKFEVVTDYSILKQSSTFIHPSSVKTCLAFKNDAPTVLSNGGNRYKPVYDEFTLMYLKPFDLNGSDISLELSSGQNFRLTRVLESSFKNYTNGKLLSFGAEGIYTDSLYLNYYKSFIELLLMPNTYKSEFEVELPPNEIFLNFSNLNQGESNIPTGFRPQNEIIIGEQRYYLLDATINTNNGKTKLTLLNF